jgi:GDP-L-fucose synthase
MSNNFWENKKVLLTGAHGFLGHYVYRGLLERKCKEIIVPSRKDYDLSKEQLVKKIFEDYKPIDIVIHLAVDGGGIGYMKDHPGSVLYNNLIMSTLLQEYSMRNGVKKFVGIGSVCAYPKFTPVPFKEEYLWEGYPEETNAPYGLSKKMMMVQSQAYRDQYGFDSIHLMPVNLYGPYDNFSLEDSHVIPALIRKMIEAREDHSPKVILWGSGKVSREFLFVKDCAEGIILASENYSGRDPINLGSGKEICIKELAEKIKVLCNYKGDIFWDTSKPDGQPRRCLDVQKSEKEFNFKAKTSLEDGLKETIQWFLENSPLDSFSSYKEFNLSK